MEGSFAQELYAESLQVSRLELDPASTTNAPTDSDENNLKQRNEPSWDDVSDGETEMDSTLDLDREWQRRHDQFHAIGYRDGLTAGKEASAQEGFNIGFKQSVLVGYKWGLVRGVTSALACLPDGLKEILVERQENQKKFKDLYESVHSISTSAALKLFHTEIITNKLAEVEGDVESAASPQQKNSNCSWMGNHYEELKSLLTESPVIIAHNKFTF